MIAESGLTPHSATMKPLWSLLLGQSFPHTFEQPVELFDTLFVYVTYYRRADVAYETRIRLLLLNIKNNNDSLLG